MSCNGYINLFIKDGNVDDILLRLEGFCEDNIDIKGAVFCGFHKVKDLLIMDIKADYDIQDNGLLVSEKVIGDCVYDKLVCMTRGGDDETVVKAWDNAELVYDFDLGEKKQWIAEGYSDYFKYFDDPSFWDLKAKGLDWNEDWDKIEKIFLEKYRDGEPEYFSYILKKAFPSEMKIIDDKVWGWDMVFNKLDWYLVFEKPGVEANSRICGKSPFEEYDNLIEWYP